MARPTVSVIIPTHNRATVVSCALDSIFAQDGAGTLFQLDVIVVDDASTDSTPAVIARYPHVRYLRLDTNQGIGGARNAGLAESRGTFIAFLDDDDVWKRNKLSRQLPALDARPAAGAAYGQVVIASSRGEMIFPDSAAPSGDIFERLLFVNLCMLPAMLVRRSAFDRVGNFTMDLLEDYDLWLRIARYFPFIFVPAVVGVYRSSSEGVLNTAMRDGRYAEMLERITERALATLPAEEASAPLRRRVRAAVDLRVADACAARREDAQAWRRLQRGIDCDPGILLNSNNRRTVAHILCRHVINEDDPAGAARRALTSITANMQAPGVAPRPRLTQLLADTYWEIAVNRAKGVGCRANTRLAVGAAARALALRPYDLQRWRALLRFRAGGTGPGVSGLECS